MRLVCTSLPTLLHVLSLLLPLLQAHRAQRQLCLGAGAQAVTAAVCLPICMRHSPICRRCDGSVTRRTRSRSRRG
jgi:hypothetical protein|eukprot:COSAG01_NODE_7634_length_3119_cov_2.884768_4_plen_75_part_00